MWAVGIALSVILISSEIRESRSSALASCRQVSMGIDGRRQLQGLLPRRHARQAGYENSQCIPGQQWPPAGCRCPAAATGKAVFSFHVRQRQMLQTDLSKLVMRSFKKNLEDNKWQLEILRYRYFHDVIRKITKLTSCTVYLLRAIDIYMMQLKVS